MFIQRLFEQEVELALEKLLGTRGSWAATFDQSNAAAHQSKLRLLAGTYAKTVKLAANCERALRGVQVGGWTSGLELGWWFLNPGNGNAASAHYRMRHSPTASIASQDHNPTFKLTPIPPRKPAYKQQQQTRLTSPPYRRASGRRSWAPTPRRSWPGWRRRTGGRCALAWVLVAPRWISLFCCFGVVVAGVASTWS